MNYIANFYEKKINNKSINLYYYFFFNYFLDDVPPPPAPPSPLNFHLIYDENLGNFIGFF